MFMYRFQILSIAVQEFKKSEIGIGEMDVYNEIHISIRKKHKWKSIAGPWNGTRDPCMTSKVLYHWAIQAN